MVNLRLWIIFSLSTRGNPSPITVALSLTSSLVPTAGVIVSVYIVFGIKNVKIFQNYIQMSMHQNSFAYHFRLQESKHSPGQVAQLVRAFTVLALQGCGFNLQSGHMQEATNE
uniref:Putative e3 ubiquitin-protein ligase mycbp2 n=1 Tax=Ixodes ricinus TaxID=34613 RepID=A0A0K8RKG7_IXORI